LILNWYVYVFKIVVSLLIASAAAAPSWNTEYHVPEIKNGVPVDTQEVQHARAKHFTAIAKAGGYATDSTESYKHADEDQPINIKYDGKYGYHYPTIKNGVPIDTEAVQHARAAPFDAVAKTPVDDQHYNTTITEPMLDEKKPKKWKTLRPLILLLTLKSNNDLTVFSSDQLITLTCQWSTTEFQSTHQPFNAQNYIEKKQYQEEKTEQYTHADQKYNGKYGYQQPARTAHMAKVAEAQTMPESYSEEEHYLYEVPAIHNGVPVETSEVQLAKATHFAAVAVAKAQSGSDKHDDGLWEEEKKW
jgi:hypothetical protein